jgi:hypothetical protein
MVMVALIEIFSAAGIKTAGLQAKDVEVGVHIMCGCKNLPNGTD